MAGHPGAGPNGTRAAMNGAPVGVYTNNVVYYEVLQ